MKKRMMKTGLVAISIMVASFLLLGGVAYVNQNTVNTMTVSRDLVEDKLYQTGWVTCQAEPLRGAADGEVLFVYEEGRFVLPHVKLATVYSGVLDENIRQQLRTLNHKMVLAGSLESHRRNLYMDTGAMSREINKAFGKITAETAEGNYKNVYELSNEILSYQNRILEERGEKKAEPVLSLSAEVAALEKGIQAPKKTYQSPMAGLFSSQVDSFDELFTPEIPKTLTPKEYGELVKQKPLSYQGAVLEGQIFAKVINNFEWFVAALFPIEALEGLSPGSFVELRMLNHSDLKVNAVVESLSPEEEGQVVAVLKSTQYVEGIYTAREVEFELIKKTYEGLKIPLSALVEEGEETFVFVVKDGLYRRVKVRVLYREKNFALIEDLSSEVIQERQHVILYDLVVVNPETVKEGDIAG